MAFLNFLQQTSYSFEGKKEDERVILFLHRHWYVVVSKLIVLVIFAVVPLILFVMFGQQVINNGLLSLFALCWSAVIMLCWLMFFYSLTLYTLDTWLVTNLRIINSVQHGFFNRTVAELGISSIQDVSIKIDGAMATMLTFGDIEVQTAGSAHHFVFEEIPNPQKVKDEVVRIVDEYRRSHPNASSL